MIELAKNRRRRWPALGAAALWLGLACKVEAPGVAPPPVAEARAERVLAFASEQGPGARDPAYALTASDGSGLRLAFVQVRAVVQGPLALTQLHLGFDNPEGRTIEGRFAVTMPEGAAISRFAMKIGEQWQEGEVVERLAATQVYERYLHRQVDPALLEHDAGNRFRARVFPILAGERKELIISYSQELADPRAPYRLPLLGLAQLDALDVRVFVSGEGDGARVLTLDRRDYVPEGDLLLREASVRGSLGVRHGSLVAARALLVAAPGADATRTTGAAAGWTLLLDTSASQAVGFAGRVRRLRPLIAALAARERRDVHVEVIGFDQEQVRFYSGPASGFGDAQVNAVIARGALGASDLAEGLREAGRVARSGSRVVLVSDGIATAGETGGLALGIAAAGLGRIDAIVAEGASDGAMLRALTRSAPGSTGVVVDGAQGPGELVARLAAPVLHDVLVEVPGSRWSWPLQLDGVQAGDAVLVYAELDEGAPLVVRFKAPLVEQSVATETVARPLLERAWRGAQLRELVAEHDRLAEADPWRASLRARIVELSVVHRVLGPFTAMLVLETEADYQRFRLHRRSLSDILVVGDAGLDVLQRDLTGVLSRARAATKGPTGSSSTAVDPEAPVSAQEEPGRVDSDGDGLSDATDGCPMSPEDFDGMEDWDGCPDLLMLDNCQIEISERVYFEPRSAVVSLRMHRVLDEVVDTLNAAPDIEIWVDGHADSREEGPDRLSRILSQRRIDAVIEYLRKAGIDPVRLEPRAMGEMIPIQDNKTAKGRAANRRVDFNLQDCERFPARHRWAASRRAGEPALAGEFLTVDQTLQRDAKAALPLARAWWSRQPGDVLAALALGRSFAAVGLVAEAARAYGSLIDLSPSRAEYRRHAGQRLEAVGAFALAVDTYRQAALLRPDHPSSHRLLAFALARLGRHAEAFAAAQAGLEREYPSDRFPRVHELLRDDLAILGAAWIRSEPAAAPEVTRRLARFRLAVADTPSLSFVLTWETDAADVDLHVLDASGHHPYIGAWSSRVDNTEGYGPESQVIGGTARAYPYTVNVFYASRRAMGHAMGAVQVLEHDGHGRLGFATLPFVLMREQTNLDIGVVSGSLLTGGGGAITATAPE